MRTLVTILVCVFALAIPARAETKKQPVLLDTDIGNYLDDALALSLLLASPDVELKAITTSGGDCEDRAWIVCRLLTMVERKDIPVAWGRDPQPKGEVKEMFQYRYHPAVLFNRTAKPLPDKDAADLLYEKLKEQPKGETTLLAIGPLTNVERLLGKYPDSNDLLKRIVVMGGQLQRGKEPEWNIAQDAKAAQAVFKSGVPLVMVPLDATADLKLDENQRDQLFAAQTMLTQQLQTLYELSNDEQPGMFDAIAAAAMVDDGLGTRAKRQVTISDDGFTSAGEGADAELITTIDRDHFAKVFRRIAEHGEKVQPRPLRNFSKLIERKGLPARVHAFEDYETDIEHRWWLTGRPLMKGAPNGKRAIQSILTLDFDDLQGDLKSMYSAVVFNPVPGPPMGPKTRLSFRYKLEGTDQLRVQLYSLSNGYHRYLALKDLPQDTWQEGTVDMTEMRRPDGSGGALAEDERIDDIQFYVEPKGHVSIDDVVLYDEAPEGERQPFPKRLVFTGWFDTGKQGQEWPGDYAIVEHEKPRKWKAAKSVLNKQLDQPWLRISFRGQRPIGRETVVRFKYRLKGADSILVQIVNSKNGMKSEQRLDAKPGEWQEESVRFELPSLPVLKNDEILTADELRFLLPQGAELLVDDVLVYEPGESK